MLPALGRLSITRVWPSDLDMACATVRAVMSAMPPGAKGTISVMGFTGHAGCARARPGRASAAASSRLRWMGESDGCGLFMRDVPSIDVPGPLDGGHLALAQDEAQHVAVRPVEAHAVGE